MHIMQIMLLWVIRNLSESLKCIGNQLLTRLYHVLFVYALERDYEQDLNGGVIVWL